MLEFQKGWAYPALGASALLALVLTTTSHVMTSALMLKLTPVSLISPKPRKVPRCRHPKTKGGEGLETNPLSMRQFVATVNRCR